MKKSFTLIELIIVIVVIAILVIKTNFVLSDTSLNQAADQVVSNINYARELALKDNKFQYYPISNSKIELNRTKYWFKQWWQIRFSKSNDEYWYEVFSDVPIDSGKNFDRVGYTPTSLQNFSIAHDGQKKLLIGICGGSNYPDCEDINQKLNLTKYYGIKKIKYTNLNTKRLIFDNYGNIYLREGDVGDGEDINPYDKNERIPLTKTAKITLCKDDNCEKNISICITPKVGFAYICE